MPVLQYQTRIVHIGDVPLGGHFPVRIQSMTSTNTMDTLATVEQSIRMIEAGCEYVRITAPGVKEAENLRVIKKELRKRGHTVPLIADIHYQPKAATIAAQYVEKIRINPGNYVDRKRGKLEYSPSEYQAELEKIRDRLKPLLDVCKTNGTALRIGSNHGSLSERILLRYGDTPLGMVESALEFIGICEDQGFRELVVSMKASNVKVMLQANRLLVSRMMQLGMNYPIHLGVTEAGDAEDGRIKSAAGIGPLLLEGIGDTIRVSLTEDPEYEIPVARELVRTVRKDRQDAILLPPYYNDYKPDYKRRTSSPLPGLGAGTPPAVVAEADSGQKYSPGFEPDFIFHSSQSILQPFKPKPGDPPEIRATCFSNAEELEKLLPGLDPSTPLVYNPTERIVPQDFNQLSSMLRDLANPFIFGFDYGSMSYDQLLIAASVDFSCFLTEGLLDGIWIQSDTRVPEQIAVLAYGILQSTGERISKTEYIACPSCGRTLFNIQSTLQVIKKRTSGLKGLKIGVMGCCVNGPGEMADAHYGYVGAGRGKITLYKGKQIIKTGIKEEFAVDELVRLIKENGDWK